MRLVIQRVKTAEVSVKGHVVSQIEKGFLVLVGITHEDTMADAEQLAKKTALLRVFEDEDGKMNQSIHDVNGAILSVSQFTLYGSTKKGNRPSFTQSAAPDKANTLYEAFNAALRQLGLVVKTGVFGAHMDVSLINDGPVTIIMESKDGKIQD